MYLKANNGQVEKYPYSIGALRKENPNTSFPKNPSDSALAGYGVYPVIEANPTVGIDQKLVKSWTPELIANVWTLNHQAVDMTADEIAERTAVEEANVREQRDTKLAECDWTACSDVTMSEAMTTYRQALRDITAQAGFPWTVEWPTQPE